MTPERVRDMARRRGLQVHKAKRGGWYVSTGPYIIYCSHDWEFIKTFVRRSPILIKRKEEE